MATEAGKGEHHVYKILPAVDADAAKLERGRHYLGVDAVAWFINKQSGWFTDRMASGTLEITLAGGLEKYQAALGTFELKGGAMMAPVFESPVLPDRNFVGGPITLNGSLTAIKKDTILAGMLKSAASASLGIVAGMVQTASATGPAKLLAAAGDDLVSGVKKVLSETGAKREALFDFSGLQFSMQPDVLVGREIFILMHRGAALDEKQLTVKASGQLLLPYLGATALGDGAWLLLRLRRSDEYTGVRDWYNPARTLRGKIESLVKDVELGVVAKDDALSQLRPSATGSGTIFDDFARLRTIIQNDFVLSERQAGTFVGDLSAVITAAKKAISAHDAAQFTADLSQLRIDLAQGRPLEGDIGSAFRNEIANLARSRAINRDIQPLDPDALVSTAQYMPKTLSDLSGNLDNLQL
jgi:hypothetical protein